MKKFVCFPADLESGSLFPDVPFGNNYRIPERCDRKVMVLSRNYERT